MRRDPARVLVVARGHIADLIQTTPALRAIRTSYPHARISVLVNEYTRGLLEGCPYVDEVIYGFAYEQRTRAKRLGEIAKLVRRLALRFDVVIALRHSPGLTPYLALATGARIRSGFDRPGMLGRLITHNAGPEHSLVSHRVTNLRALQPLGVTGDPAYESLAWHSESARESVRRLLAAHRLDTTRYAVFQVSANWGCNELSETKWAEVGDRIYERYGIQPVVVGVDDANELAKFASIVRLARHQPVSLHGKTSLAELIEVVRNAALVVATDSSLTQIALTEAVPAVVMFGIEPMVFNGPLPSEGDTMEAVQHWEGPELAPPTNPHCTFGGSYCHSEHCRENSSLEQTTVDELMARVGAALERVGSSGRRRLPVEASIEIA